MNRQFIVEFSQALDITKAGRKVAALILNRIPDGMEDDINEANEDFLDYFNGSVGMGAMDNYEDYLDAIAEEIADAIMSLTRQDLIEIIRGNKNARRVLENEEITDEDDEDTDGSDDEDEEYTDDEENSSPEYRAWRDSSY